MKRCQHTRHLYPQNTEEAVTVVLAAHYSKKGGQLMRYVQRKSANALPIC